MTAAVDSSAVVENAAAKFSDELVFDSHDAAYCYYKEYAKSVGFGTAKLSSRRSRASKEFIDAKFSCIRYGNKQQSDDAINPRPSPKIGCKASMHVKRRQDGKWYVYNFVKEHNHDLLPSQVHFFRSHRDVDPAKCDTKVRRKKNHSSVSKTLVPYQSVNSLEVSMRNQHDRGRCLILEPGDAQLLLEFFTFMQEANPKFFYAVDFNEEHRLRNLFWVDAKGVEDYANFSDVVLLDTTFFSNKYKIPLVLFIGVNHHMKATLLGCGLIADDTAYTFIWLMQTWLLAMGGQPPEVLLSDQKHDIKVAAAAVLPKTRHFFCLWCVMEKIPPQVEYLSLWHEGFMAKFMKCVLKSWTEEQFEKRWWKLNERFHLRDVDWIQSLYADRRYWVPAFMRGVFFACFSTASRAECLISSLDKHVFGHTTVRDFIDKYRVIIEDRYEEEAKADFDAWHESPELKSPSPFEKQVAHVYTNEVFRKFQVEVLGAAACHLKKEYDDDTIAMFSVKDFEDNQSYMVEWNEAKLDLHCSCLSFEYRGYLCRHAIVVLQMSGIFTIPSKYILKRWTNAAKSKHALGERLEDVQVKIRRCNDLCRRAVILCEEGSLSLDSFNFAVAAIKEGLIQISNSFKRIDSLPVPANNLRNEETNSYDYKQHDDSLTAAGKLAGKRSSATKGKSPVASLPSMDSHDFHAKGVSHSHSDAPLPMQPQLLRNFGSPLLYGAASSHVEESPLPP